MGFNNWSSIVSLHKMSFDKKKVCIVGSGNWGSAIAKIIGHNVVKHSEHFEEKVSMWVFEEMVEGKKLTEIINETHINVKYLPKHPLPANIIAVPDLLDASRDADILIFVVPHQFINRLCDQMAGNIKSTAIGLSLIKGFMTVPTGGIELISHAINKKLNIPVSVLMGANLAPEVADEKFCETTIGSTSLEHGNMLRDIIQTDYFRVVVVKDVEAVEMCGALKNIVACGAGFVDGLGYGDNTKAAVIRLGLMEMIKFAELFYPGSQLSTFFESCGVADLITTCYGGRNRRVSEAFIKTKKSIAELEAEMLNGQKLQGPETARELQGVLKARGIAPTQFPLFTAVYNCCYEGAPVASFLKTLENHPAHN